jgi:hypothetical protein
LEKRLFDIYHKESSSPIPEEMYDQVLVSPNGDIFVLLDTSEKSNESKFSALLVKTDNYEIVHKELNRVNSILWELDEDVDRLKQRTGFGTPASYDELGYVESKIIKALGAK